MSVCQADKVRTAKAMPKYHTQVGPNDILLGRGAPIINNEGNRRFRNLIMERKKRYMALSRHQDKNCIVYEIINIIISREGMFLKKVDDESRRSTLGIDSWEEVDDSTIIQKVKQALRENENRYHCAGQLITQSLTPPTPKEVSKKQLPFNAAAALSKQCLTTALPQVTPTLRNDSVAQFLKTITNQFIALQQHDVSLSGPVQSIENLLQSTLQQIQSDTRSTSIPIHETEFHPMDQSQIDLKLQILSLAVSVSMDVNRRILENRLLGQLNQLSNLCQHFYQICQPDILTSPIQIQGNNTDIRPTIDEILQGRGNELFCCLAQAERQWWAMPVVD
jgi:hypothetical protein